MALPTPVRTYQATSDTITVLGSAIANSRRLARTIKDRFISFASAPLTVVGSSNGVTSGASDLWATDGDLISSGAGGRSWFVFGIPQIHASFQLLMEFGASATFYQAMRLYVSPTVGFTMVSHTARPTASDEIPIINTGSWTPASDVQMQLRIYRATNGRGLRLLLFSAGLLINTWIIDRPETPDPNWTNPSASMAYVSLVGAASSTFFHAGVPQFNGRGNTGVTMPMALMTWGGSVTSQLLPQTVSAQDSYSGEYLLPRVRLVSTVVGNLGDRGVLDDVWLCSSNIPSGDTFPNDTSRTHIVASPLVFPHDGSVVATS